MSDGRHYVVCQRDADLWWDGEAGDWTANIFAATRYAQNDAVLLATQMKMAGIQAATDTAIIAARRVGAGVVP